MSITIWAWNVVACLCSLKFTIDTARSQNGDRHYRLSTPAFAKCAQKSLVVVQCTTRCFGGCLTSNFLLQFSPSICSRDAFSVWLTENLLQRSVRQFASLPVAFCFEQLLPLHKHPGDPSLLIWLFTNVAGFVIARSLKTNFAVVYRTLRCDILVGLWCTSFRIQRLESKIFIFIFSSWYTNSNKLRLPSDTLPPESLRSAFWTKNSR